MTHGLNAETIELLEQTIRNDITAGDYDGARIILARRGEVALDATLGWAEPVPPAVPWKRTGSSGCCR